MPTLEPSTSYILPPLTENPSGLPPLAENENDESNLRSRTDTVTETSFPQIPKMANITSQRVNNRKSQVNMPTIPDDTHVNNVSPAHRLSTKATFSMSGVQSRQSSLYGNSMLDALSGLPGNPSPSPSGNGNNSKRPSIVRRVSIVSPQSQLDNYKSRFSANYRFNRIPALLRFKAAVEAVIKSKKATSIFSFKGPVEDNDEDDDPEEKMEKFRTQYSNLKFNIEDFKAKRTDILTAHTKEVLKKSAETRTDLDIDLIYGFVQGMKSFARHSANMKRELCKILTYESFGRGRTIVKQGHTANSFYYIVRGEVSVCKEEQDEDNNSVVHVQVTELKAGDSFGDVALTKDIKRTATIKTLKKCEFLKVEKEHFQNLLKQTFEQSVNKRIELLQGIPIFRDIEVKKLQLLASLAKAVEYTPHSNILEEGQPSEDIFFISSGNCKVLKRIKIVAIPIAGSYKYRKFTSDDDVKPREQIMMKTVHICRLQKFDFFGEDDLFMIGRRQALSEAFNSNKSQSTWTVTAETKVECLTIPKIDFFRVLNVIECDDISRRYVRYPQVEKLVNVFLVKDDWARYKGQVMKEIYRNRRHKKTV